MPLEKARQILDSIKKGDVRSVYFLTGDEPFYIDGISNYIEENLLADEEKEFNQIVYYGRDIKVMGNPLKITDVIAQLPGTYYVTRQAVYKPGLVRKTKKAIQKAFEFQKMKKGTCFIEVVSNCPSNWKMTPLQSNKWLEENMLPFYPLGDLKKPNGKEN